MHRDGDGERVVLNNGDNGEDLLFGVRVDSDFLHISRIC
jgi:hypothetical protein